jgi:hypothetical protein
MTRAASAVDETLATSSHAIEPAIPPRARPPPSLVAGLLAKHGSSPLAPPSTWLLSAGWKRAKKGALRFDEMPGV